MTPEMAVRGESITAYVSGTLANHVHDGEYALGSVYLTAWKAKIHCVDPCVRVY